MRAVKGTQFPQRSHPSIRALPYITPQITAYFTSALKFTHV